MKRHKIARQRIEVRERTAKALELRKDGLTYAAIAEQIGYASRQSARKAVMTAFREITREPAEQLREKERIRLEAIIEANWKKAMAGNYYAAKIIIEAIKTIARFFGLEAPEKYEVGGLGSEPFTFRILRPEFEKPAISAPAEERDAVGERRRDFQEGG